MQPDIEMTAEAWRVILEECELEIHQLESLCLMLVYELEQKEIFLLERFNTRIHCYTLAAALDELF